MHCSPLTGILCATDTLFDYSQDSCNLSGVMIAGDHLLITCMNFSSIAIDLAQRAGSAGSSWPHLLSTFFVISSLI